MRQRSKAGSKPANAQRRKTAVRKSGSAPKAVRRRSFAGTHETELARVIRERDEAREQQTATADVLKIISRSTFDLKEVLNTLTESAARLCAGDKGLIFQRDGDVLRLIANLGHSREAERYWLEHPLPVDGGSATGRAVLEGRAIHIPDVLADPKYRATRYQELSGYRSVLCVPLLRDGTTIGTFSLSRHEVTPFTDKQIEMVETFADQAVIAIENTRLFEAEQQRTRQLTEALEQQTATSELLQVISSSPGDLQPVFESLLRNATRLCKAKFGTLYFQEGVGLRLVAAHDMPAAFSEAHGRVAIEPAPGGGLERAMKIKLPVQIADLAATEAYRQRHPSMVEAVELGGIRTVVAVPMLKNDEPIGVISINNQEVIAFDEKQIALLTNFAAQAVIAIENARLLNELRQRTADLTEALEQQTATSEVLQVISSSPGDLRPVFAAMLENAVRICDAKFGNIYRWDGDALHLMASHNIPAAFAEARGRSPNRPSPETPTGRMIATKTFVHVPDLAAEPAYAARDPWIVVGVELAGVRTLLVMPMLKENELVGAFTIYRQEVRPFIDKQIALVTNFAAQAVIAIENARLLNELRQRTNDLTEALEQQTATSEVLQVISSSPGDLEPVFASMLEKAIRVCEATFGNIYRWDGEAFILRKLLLSIAEATHRLSARLHIPFLAAWLRLENSFTSPT